MAFYFGPNSYKTLQNLNVGIDNHELQRIVPLGWGIFGWVNRWLVIPVFNFLLGKVGSMGILILLLTLIIKFVLLPLVYRSYISTAKMRILKPEIDEIKNKYGDDMQKIQVENLALYKKAGVNPMSGCVPMLLQMPILFAMFQFFPVLFELRQESFLWSKDLSAYDSILDLGFNIPFYGSHVSLFTLLMTISTLIYTHLNNQISGITGQMKWIGYIMPIIFLGVLNSYPSGLTWYYFVSNMVTFGQQFAIRRLVDDAKLHAQIAEARKKPVKKSNFSKRLEEVMKAQQQKSKQTGKKSGPPNRKK
jgi:YidC/Oxa1 family membrane protein insertase